LGYELKAFVEAFGEFEYVYEVDKHAGELDTIFAKMTTCDYSEDDI
jgi:hypothetical protein